MVLAGPCPNMMSQTMDRARNASRGSCGKMYAAACAGDVAVHTAKHPQPGYWLQINLGQKQSPEFLQRSFAFAGSSR